MKKLIITSVAALLTFVWNITSAREYPEEYLGLPGDNLNLYAVMKLFQESETLEGFERSLNDENSRINNLDLNGDNLVDYLMVFDYVDGNTHTIVLRAALDRNELQDVAVFTVQRYADESVQIQLVGDEALYGKNYIIEPIYAEEGETPNPGYIGTPVRGQKVTVVRTSAYEVAAWPLISFIFRPTYVVWHSSWHWDYYPSYWNPWRPFYWHAYYGYHYHWHDHYYAHYRPWHHYRHHHYTNYYYTHVRTYSPTVVVNINKGNYRNTYSRPDTRRDGERLYARTNNGRSSLNSNTARVRSSGSTTVNRAAVKSASSSGRRSSSEVSGRSSTKSGSEIRTNNSRRSSEGVSSRTSTGRTENRNSGVERKSGTVAPERRTSSGNSAAVTRRAEPSSPARSTVRPSAERNTEVSRSKASAPSSRRTESVREVRQSSGNRPSAAVSGRTSSPSVRQSEPRREAPAVSSKSAQRSQPAVKSAPSRSSSRSSGTSVKTSRSAGRESSSSSERNSSRSSSSGGSGRR